MPIDMYSFRMSGFCRAVLMVAKQLNIDLNEKTVDLMEGDQLKPEYLKVLNISLNQISNKLILILENR